MPEPNALTGAELDRAADRRRRDAGWLAAQAEHPAARTLVLGDAGIRVADGRIELLPLAEADTDEGHDPPVLLGLDGDGPVFAIDEEPPSEPGRRPALVGAGGRRGEPAPQSEGRLGLRSAAQELTQADGGLAAYAAGLVNWHRGHRFCSVCAGATTPAEGGLTRECARCGTHHHPRTDPVVIMLVTDGDRVLLGRQRTWPQRRFSCLAGFVSPGESLEEAVAREVREEVGVRVGAADYRGSQPWPFPASLMLGFTVPWLDGEIGGTDDELQDARWFGRDEVARAAREDSWDHRSPEAPADGLLLPPRSAIARRLVEGWLAG